jgi:hypothetical protein
MIDGILAQAIATAISGAFPNVHIGTPQDNDSIAMPAILMQLRSDFVVGSTLERGTLTLNVCSQADDTTPEEHAQFCLDVATYMRTLSITSDVVQLDGLVTASADEQHAERHWQTPLVYTIGFSPKS